VEAAFFDLDKTVIAKASMVAFGRPLYRHGLLSRRLLLRALWGQLVYLHLGADEAKLARMRETVLALTRGWEQARISAIVRETLAEVVEPIVFAEAVELIEAHRAAGRRVFIVSASPEEIVAPIAQHLGVDQAIASRARVDRHGRYTGEMEFYAYGPHKAEAMRAVAAAQGIDLAASYAYSDSATDIPMLEAVGHPVAVNPDRELARVARQRGWEIRHFSRPVRLRDRLPAPPPARVAAAAGGVALAAGALAGAWWWRNGRSTRAGPAGPARTGGDSVPGRTTLAQAARTFLAARAPSATRTASSSSFFMGRTLAGRRPGRKGGTGKIRTPARWSSAGRGRSSSARASR
jgi:HAD superfamily hydrolase (TIGR01490 family)